VCITADGGWRRGKIIPLKENVDKALAETPTIAHCVVVRRTGTRSDSRAAAITGGTSS